ncbi:MAG: DNA ligase D, partial [Bryobacteraceae bacterium]
EWLIIKKRDDFADPDWDIEEHATSVKTGRTQDEIAADLPPTRQAPRGKASAGKAPTGKAPAGKAAKKRAPKASADPSRLTGAAKAEMPKSVQPMMAFPAEKPPSAARWVYEVKWDGVRAICFIEDQKLRMTSRNGNSFDRQYPELSVLPHYVNAREAIIDGEIAVLDNQGRSRFELIQPRIHQTDPNSIAHLSRNTPVRFFAFDLLYLDGYDLRQAPLVDRKELLKKILEPCPRMQFSEHFEARGTEMLDSARQLGLEGVLAKRADSKYESRRSRNWLKIKIIGQQEFVICGYTHGERSTFSSLVLGLYEKGKLVYVGNVGTGFNEKSLALLHAKMEPLKTTRSPFAKKPSMLRSATWVEPVLVCEIKFSEWTRDGKLRAPVFLGLRNDKKPEECVRETPIEQETEPEAKALKSGEPLLDQKAKEVTLDIDGQKLKFTNLDKVLYPKDGFTKRDILNYYNSIADLIVPHLKDRPLSLKRYPNGIDEEFFFQKDITSSFPDWLRTEPVFSEHRNAPINFAVASDRATLLYLANLACIDQNPWMSRVGSLDNPDFMLIDLDPQECPYDKIVEAAQLVREKLDQLGLEGYPKTTGGDGMHVYVPVEPRYTYEQVRSFAEILSQLVVSEKSDLFTTPRSVSKRRKGRVYFDYLQISTGKTISAPYVLRAYNGAPVSTPLRWDEVKKGLSPKQFNLTNAVERFRETGDLFKPVLTRKQKLEPAIRRLEKLMAG